VAGADEPGDMILVGFQEVSRSMSNIFKACWPVQRQLRAAPKLEELTR
jgi:hypothetical protein